MTAEEIIRGLAADKTLVQFKRDDEINKDEIEIVDLLIAIGGAYTEGWQDIEGTGWTVSRAVTKSAGGGKIALRVKEICDRHGCPVGVNRLDWIDKRLGESGSPPPATD